MKQLLNYNKITDYLKNIFELLNQKYFNNELDIPIITIQNELKSQSNFSFGSKIWETATGVKSYEINISTKALNRPIEIIVSSLLHEMVHYYNYTHNIKDCSRGNTYHNKKFKISAEEHGLFVIKHPIYGWVNTKPSKELLDFVYENHLTNIMIERLSNNGDKKNSSKKYICPKCGNSIRATKNVNIICGDCNLKMIIVKK